MDDVLIIDYSDVSMSPVKPLKSSGRLRKRKVTNNDMEEDVKTNNDVLPLPNRKFLRNSVEDRIKNVFSTYEFMREDNECDGPQYPEDDDWVVEDGEPWTDEMRHEVGIVDKDRDFIDAMIQTRPISFSNSNIWTRYIPEMKSDTLREFINNDIVREKFDNVWTMIRSFNDGGRYREIIDLWIKIWSNEAVVKKSKTPIPYAKCIACDLPKQLTHEFRTHNSVHENLGLPIGSMGPHCYRFKFSLLIKLGKICNSILLTDCSVNQAIRIIKEEMNPILVEMSTASIQMK
jgi:hypothetical protein